MGEGEGVGIRREGGNDEGLGGYSATPLWLLVYLSTPGAYTQ